MRVRTVAEIAECADAVDAGEIVVLPTRRWYMLCADTTHVEVCRRIFEGKGRPTTKPLALVMPSNAAVAAARFSLAAEARRLVEGALAR
ncbi:MAG: Sua5/YciO/YrdC/YwlC family protein [Pseudonocardiaceae bacterium]